MQLIHKIAQALGLVTDDASQAVPPERLFKLLEYGPFLDKVEEQMVGAPQAVAASVALQRDAANEYNNTPTPGAPPVTQERMQQAFGTLYLSYAASGEVTYLAPLKAMMNELGLNPSNQQLAAAQRGR